jgi:ABC-type dipeptide/oligopeptide/nickel transport system ATPase component
VGAIETVQQLLLDQRAKGCAILLVSEDLDELLSLSDRIAVMYEGHVVGVVCSGDFDITKIGLMMTGTLPHDLPAETVEPETPTQGSTSSFDEVLEDLRHYDETAQAEQHTESELTHETDASIEEPPQTEPEELPTPPEDPELNLSEKERVLRKVLGEKYNQGDEE